MSISQIKSTQTQTSDADQTISHLHYKDLELYQMIKNKTQQNLFKSLDCSSKKKNHFKIKPKQSSATLNKQLPDKPNSSNDNQDNIIVSQQQLHQQAPTVPIYTKYSAPIASNNIISDKMVYQFPLKRLRTFSKKQITSKKSMSQLSITNQNFQQSIPILDNARIDTRHRSTPIKKMVFNVNQYSSTFSKLIERIHEIEKNPTIFYRSRIQTLM